MTPESIREWRSRMGFTQAQAAEALGLKPRVIAYFESGERNVSGTVEKLCAAIEELAKRKRKR